MSKLALALCQWGSPPSGGVVPAAIKQTVTKRRAQGCCSPALPTELPPETRLGEVRFIAPHDRGGDCFDRCPELNATSAQLKF
jgi:hypothetical protein